MIRSLLSVVQQADNLPPHPHSPYPTHSPDGSERYVPFHLTFADFQAGLPPIGLLRPAVVRELRSQISSNEDEGEGAEVDDEAEGNVWQMYITVSEPATSNVENGSKRQRVGEKQAREVGTGQEAQEEEGGDLDMRVDCVFFSDWVLSGGPERISSVLADIVGRWKAEGKFPGPLAGWRNEQYQLYYPSSSTAPSLFPSVSHRMIGGTMSNKAFTLERAACAIFGLPTYGVHMTAYEGEGDGMKVWVPKRAATKATWPGKLDNTVAGGITAGMHPLETMIKECDEEADLPEDLVQAHLKNAGVVTYFYITEDGYLQPEVEYIYDLPLPPQSSPEYIKPRPHDDEVESFALLDLPTIREHLFAGDFKPNCGAILVDFLLRHGFITPENEPKMLEIRWSLARQLGLAMPA